MPGHGFLGVERFRERRAAWEKLGECEREKRRVREGWAGKDVGPREGSGEGKLGWGSGARRRMALKDGF